MDSVIADRYALLVQPQVRFYSSASFPGALYACKPGKGDKGTKERIQAIRLTSDQDFDATHPAGSLLNDLFLLDDPKKGLTIELESFLQSNPGAFQHPFLLKLRKEPTTIATHQFTISYAHTDGEQYELTTKPVKLL